MLAFVLAQLSAPVEQHIDEEGASVMNSGDPGEVIVRLTESHATVAAFAVAWERSRPIVEPIAIGTLNWTAISAEAAMRVVKALITAAREARRSTFVVCSVCDRSTPPERMYSEDECQDCVEVGPDVVH